MWSETMVCPCPVIADQSALYELSYHARTIKH